MHRRTTTALLLTAALAAPFSAALAGCGKSDTGLTEAGGVKGQEPPATLRGAGIPDATAPPQDVIPPSSGQSVDGSPPTSTAAGGGVGPVPTPVPGAVPPAPPTTCVSAPATTAAGQKGGGEIVCSSPGDPGGAGDSSASPPTTIPGPDSGPYPTPYPTPDATHGVVLVSTGGSPCPASAQQCVAMYAIIPAQITLTPASGQAPSVTFSSSGSGGTLIAPGTWQVTAVPTTGDRSCTPGTVTAVAGTTVNVSIDCVLPG